MKRFLLNQLVSCSLVVLTSISCATAQIAPPVPELLFYRFSGTGTSVPNQALTPPPGTATATILGSITQGGTGQCGGALIGSGIASSSDYLNTNYAPNLTGSSWSFSFWTSNIAPNTTLYYIFGDAGSGSFRCFTNGVAGPNNWILRGGFTDVTVNGGATTAPHMTTFVYDNVANNIRGYLDGVLVTTVAQGAVTLAGAGPLKVMGYGSNVGAPLGGLLDEFRLYNRAISAAEVTALYQRNTYATIPVTACGTSYTSPSGTFTWNTPGTYTDVLPGANMYCGDSILTINLTFTPASTPLVSIAANPGTSVCATTSVTFTATPTNGGTAPTYQWYRNAVLQPGNTNTYTASGFTTGTPVYAIMTSNAACVSPLTATSNTLTMTALPQVTPTVSITANPGTAICAGQSVTFTATPVNGGTPTYQWFKNGVLQASTTNTFTDNTLTSGDAIDCAMTAVGVCTSTPTVTSNTLNIMLNPNVTPLVSIASNQGTSVCSGASVTFTATPTDGGTPTYQWYKDAVLQAPTGNTYTDNTLTNGNVITAVMTAVGVCATTPTATSNAITMTVIPNVTPGVTIVVSPSTTICSGATATFTATPVNGGGTPTYQWLKNNVLQAGTGTVYTDNNIANGDVINSVLTSSEACVTAPTGTSNNVTMTVTIPTALAGAAGTTESMVMNISGNTQVNYTDCDLIANITPSGVSPINGNTMFAVTLDNTVSNYQGQPYLQRHYDIEPGNTVPAPTATITLYALQSEFDAYNVAATPGNYPMLPTGGVDNGNVKITQYHGTGTAPGNYTGSPELVIPTVSWDAVNNWWEMTFDVTDFSGFYIHTGAMDYPLAITLKNIKATNLGSVNRIDWATATEARGDIFMLERSADGRTFTSIATIAAKGSPSAYIYNDEHPLAGVNYYRIKIADVANKANYSKVVTARADAGSVFTLQAYPNPANDKLTISLSGDHSETGAITITDMMGRIVEEMPFAGNQMTVDISRLATGNYLIRYTDNINTTTIKIGKK